nr:uncharacterized protein At1g01500 [Ipomoea batatas]
MHSEGASFLRRGHKKSFYSTDKTGSVKFEVFDRDDLCFLGFCHSNGVIQRTAFLSDLTEGTEGSPFALTSKNAFQELFPKHLKLVFHLASSSIDSTREVELYVLSSLKLDMVPDYTSYKPESEEDYNDAYWRHTEYLDGEDGETLVKTEKLNCKATRYLLQLVVTPQLMMRTISTTEHGADSVTGMGDLEKMDLERWDGDTKTTATRIRVKKNKICRVGPQDNRRER